MIEAILIIGSLVFFLWCMTAGTAWAWDYGQKWGRRDAEKKWKKERGL